MSPSPRIDRLFWTKWSDSPSKFHPPIYTPKYQCSIIFLISSILYPRHQHTIQLALCPIPLSHLHHITLYRRYPGGLKLYTVHVPSVPTRDYFHFTTSTLSVRSGWSSFRPYIIGSPFNYWPLSNPILRLVLVAIVSSV